MHSRRQLVSAKPVVVGQVRPRSVQSFWLRMDVVYFAKQEMQQGSIHYERAMMLKA